MKYAISNWIYGGESLEQTFQRLQRYSYDGVELKGEPKEYDPARVRRLCDDYDLEVLSIAGIYPWERSGRDLSNPDEERRQQAIDYVRRCCDFAAELGAPVLIVVPSAVGKTVPVINPHDEPAWEKAVQEEWANAQSSLSAIAPHAEETGVTLAVEPINRYETFLVNSAAQARELTNAIDSDAVGVHLDSFHMNIEEADPPQAVRDTADSLANVHVADSNREAVGRGHFDFRSFIHALLEINYAGSIAMEPLPPVPDPYMATQFDKFAELRDQYAQECIERLTAFEQDFQDHK
ncbi:MAG: sugar phosphate isomerase/epimerase family protein [Salinibacter sp.]